MCHLTFFTLPGCSDFCFVGKMVQTNLRNQLCKKQTYVIVLNLIIILTVIPLYITKVMTKQTKSFLRSDRLPIVSRLKD